MISSQFQNEHQDICPFRRKDLIPKPFWKIPVTSSLCLLPPLRRLKTDAEIILQNDDMLDSGKF
jgi:hypothetical protein